MTKHLAWQLPFMFTATAAIILVHTARFYTTNPLGTIGISATAVAALAAWYIAVPKADERRVTRAFRFILLLLVAVVFAFRPLLLVVFG